MDLEVKICIQRKSIFTSFITSLLGLQAGRHDVYLYTQPSSQNNIKSKEGGDYSDVLPL